jgi:hypothetical protein
MNTSFNRYVSKTQTVVENKQLETLKRHSYTLGKIETMLKNGATPDQIAALIESSK